MFVGMEKMTHSVKNILQLQFLCLLKFKNIDCDPLILEYVFTKSNTTQLSSYKPSLSGIPPRLNFRNNGKETVLQVDASQNALSWLSIKNLFFAFL